MPRLDVLSQVILDRISCDLLLKVSQQIRVLGRQRVQQRTLDVQRLRLHTLAHVHRLTAGLVVPHIVVTVIRHTLVIAPARSLATSLVITQATSLVPLSVIILQTMQETMQVISRAITVVIVCLRILETAPEHLHVISLVSMQELVYLRLLEIAPVPLRATSLETIPAQELRVILATAHATVSVRTLELVPLRILQIS